MLSAESILKAVSGCGHNLNQPFQQKIENKNVDTIISNKYHSFFHLKYLSFFKGVQPGGGGMVNPVEILLLPSDFNLRSLPSSVKDCEKANLRQI